MGRKKVGRIYSDLVGCGEIGILCRMVCPPIPVFSRYTRYAATTRVSIEDFEVGAATRCRYSRYIRGMG